ncbi:putative PurR-regulated permease PerM [Blastococcus colisei]|uniref:Putative PurR-regulated permease PerM n=1 Tax=Blastococcus colisei TaxID=1564162 RepID=A0A543PEZ1_9ACTN|nr:AI-2E family transporter [Blastococcus colisei]TQN42627.1 putative PurR-regulated permease PerM [Blastococcus colisei]
MERTRRAELAAAVPAWTVRALSVSGAVLAVAAVAWLACWFLFLLPQLTFTLAIAVFLTALTAPITGRLRRAGLPAALSALAGVLFLFAVLIGIGFLVGFRAAAAVQDLTRPLAAGIDRIRVWLIEGPLGLDAQQVAQVRNEIVTWIYQAAPTPGAGARMAVYVLGALILVAFLMFFLLKDGGRMWDWLLERVPARRRAQIDGAGQTAWDTLGRYVRGVVVVALIDAVGIGIALLLLGVPLWVSLTLLTFVGAFVPLFGATVSGAVAVLVTLVTNGLTDAVIVLVVVLVVQQVEGNLLQPLIMGRALHLHPAAILVAVTAGGLLYGIPGALLAVPVMAIAYRVLEYLRTHPSGPAEGTEPGPVAADLPAPHPAGASAPAEAVPATAVLAHAPAGTAGPVPTRETNNR